MNQLSNEKKTLSFHLYKAAEKSEEGGRGGERRGGEDSLLKMLGCGWMGVGRGRGVG